jgi:UDPglucose--hexose-1-phosphate uridylyltransferase
VPELRHDVLTGRLVLLAAARGARPVTFAASSSDASLETTRPDRVCPFCPSHEHETPPELARIGSGEPGSPGWRVRAFPNLFPIVGGDAPGPGATGAHEVVVLSPDHDATFAELDDDQAVDVLTVLRDRARAHRRAGRAHAQVLINQGRAAGASIEHPHAQVVALDFVPPAVTVAVDRFASAESDPVLRDRADAVEREQHVIGGGEVSAWCPTGSASPFETRIAAIGGGSRLEDSTDGQVLGIALVLRDVVAALGRALAEPPHRIPYNVVVHNGPAIEDPPYHWWISVIPRVAVVAGFEIGTAVLVNTVEPREAAQRLRTEL